MRTDILLSLLSLSSFLCLSFSASLAARASSFALFASLFSLSECKLLRELDPFNNDGRPSPNIDDFLCAEAGADDDDGDVVSFVGDRPLGGRKYDEDEC